MFEGIDDSFGAMIVLQLDLAEFGLQAGVGEMNGKLARGYICHNRDERDEENDWRQTDEKVGEDELVAQAPEHVLPDKTPCQGQRDADEGQADEELHEREECPDGSWNPAAEEKGSEPYREPEYSSGEPCRQPMQQPRGGLRRGRVTRILHSLPPPPPQPAARDSGYSVSPKNELRRAAVNRRETPTSSGLPKYKTDRRPTESPATEEL